MEACKKLINHLQEFESSFLSEGMSWAEYAEEEAVDIVDELQVSDWEHLSVHYKEYTTPVQAMLASVAQDFTVEKAPYSLKIITEVLLSNNPYNYEICSEFSFNLISFSRQRNKPWFWRSITKDYVEQTEGFEYKYTQSLKTIFNSLGYKKHPIAKEYLTKEIANIFKEYYNYQEDINTHDSTWNMQYAIFYINNLQFDNNYTNIKKIAKQAIDRDKLQNENQLILLDDLGFIYVRDLNYMLFVSYADVLAIEAVKIPFNKYAIHQEGLLFQTLYMVDIISYEAKGFDNLVKMTDVLFNISVKNHIFGQEVPYKKQFWLRRKLKYQVYNAHLVKSYTKKEKKKWIEDIKKGFYLIQNKNYDKPFHQHLISWDSSNREFAELIQSSSENIDFSQMYFNTAMQIGPLVLAEVYIGKSDYRLLDVKFERIIAKLYFQDISWEQLIQELTIFFGEAKKLTIEDYYKNVIWIINEIEFSFTFFGLEPSIYSFSDGSISLSIKNKKEYVEINTYPLGIVFLEKLSFEEDFNIMQTWEICKYAYINSDSINEQLNDAVKTIFWRNDSDDTIGFATQNQCIIIPRTAIEHIEIQAYDHWAGNSCTLTVSTHKNSIKIFDKKDRELLFFSKIKKEIEALLKIPVQELPIEKIMR